MGFSSMDGYGICDSGSEDHMNETSFFSPRLLPFAGSL